jgi:hypothetical protein
MSDHFSAGSADSISGSSVPACALCGNASRTSTAAGSLPGIGPVSRVIPMCAPLWPTPTANRRAGLQSHGRNYLTADGACPCRCHTSTSSPAASPAKTSPTPAKEPGSTGNARVFGRSTPDWFASYDRGTWWSRTLELFSPEGLTSFSGTWPRAGMTRNGTAYPLQPLAPLTAATGSGSSRIPTPTAGDAKSAANRTAGRSDPDSKHHSGTTLTDFTRMWPTPHGMPKEGQARNPGPSGNELGRAVNEAERQQWPTPTARDWKDTGDLTGIPENSIPPRVVDRIEREAWPTPKASDANRDAGLANRWGPGNSQRSNLKDALRYRQTEAGEPTTGSLNPAWVEWLMGFPPGWTDLEASGTHWSRRSRNGSAAGSSSTSGGES